MASVSAEQQTSFVDLGEAATAFVEVLEDEALVDSLSEATKSGR
jgi:hypothetical protein